MPAFFRSVHGGVQGHIHGFVGAGRACTSSSNAWRLPGSWVRVRGFDRPEVHRESSDKEQTFELPDGNTTVCAERFFFFGCPELKSMRKVPTRCRPTCFQTATSALSAPNVSTVTAESEVVRDVMEKSCCVALDAGDELESTVKAPTWRRTYELLDVNIITVSASNRFQVLASVFKYHGIRTTQGQHCTTECRLAL